MNINDIELKDICIGLLVEIEINGTLKRGYIKEILYKNKKEREITVKLVDNSVGIIQNIITKAQLKKENFKFYNLFIHEDKIFSIYNKKTKEYFIYTDNKSTNFIFLFNNSNIGKEVIKKLNNSDLVLKAISKKGLISDNFKKYNYTVFNINNERLILKSKLNELQVYFQNNQ